MKKIANILAVSHELALAIVARAVEEGSKSGVAVSVAVVDPSLQLIAFAKSDGSTAHSVETSRRKAQTAASTRKESGWMAEDLALALPLAAGNLLTNIPGGIPIVVDGAVVGGFGIAGGTVEQDKAIADVVLKMIEEG